MLRWLRSKVKVFRLKAQTTRAQVQQEANADGPNSVPHEIPDVPPPNSDAAQSAALMSRRARDLQIRYKQLGRIDDLNEVIALSRDVLSFHPPGHPDRSRSLNNLADNVSSRYEHLGGIDDLEEAIVLSREALSLPQPALIHARRPDARKSVPDNKHFIAIGQAHAPGFPRLPSVRIELANIKWHVKAITTLTRVQGRAAHISGVADKLGENEWVHFACHGIAIKEEPFESAFALHDGMFTIQHIIQCNLKNPEFAYLSACETTVGDEENPDEVIHRASAIQFAGFRSVIGTTWSVADYPATKVASMFYKLMIDESGCLDHTRAAWALWKTLRTVDIPINQCILYIHLGA